MLSLSKEHKKKLLEHSIQESPNEACGILAGRKPKVEKVYKMSNKDKSEKTFFMDPQQQLKVMKDIRNSGLDFIGIYHSHPETQAYPSAHDVELAYYPEVSYVIISLKNKDNPKLRSFRIIEGRIKEEGIA